MASRTEDPVSDGKQNCTDRAKRNFAQKPGLATNRVCAAAYSHPARVTIWLLALSSFVHAAELKLETLRAWDEYIAVANARAAARLAPDSSFLWAHENSSRFQRIQKGEMLASPVVGHGTRRIPSGLIHHWIGTVFIPSTTISEVFAVVRSYDRYKEIFRPVTVDAKLISQEENSDKFSLLLSKKVLFVTTTIAGEFQSTYNRVSQERWSNVSYSTRLQDVKDYGQPSERKLEPNDGSGFLWRAYSFSRYQEQDGGVYMEFEAIVLTRDVPAIWRWLVNPIIDNLSRETILTSLQKTRDAVRLTAKDGDSARQ